MEDRMILTPHTTSISRQHQHDLNGTHLTSTSAFPSLSETLSDQRVNTSHSERNASPSRASIHSTSSVSVSVTGSVPHLKRRDGNKHMRNLHSVDFPSFTPAHVNNSTAADKHSSPRVSLQAQSHLNRSNTAPSPKRPPASHSSYGVETIVGPPPSFDTRRTLSTERVWRVDRSKSLRMTLGADRVEVHQQSAPGPAERDSAPLLDSSPDTADTQSIPTPTDVEELTVMDMTVQGLGSGLGLSNSEAESKSSSGSHKSEDLFLNIARVDGSRPSSSRGDKKKSRASLPFLSSNVSVRPATSHTPETSRGESSVPTPRAGLSSYHNKRASLQFPQARGIDQTSDTGSTDASNSGYFSKRSSTLYADTIRPVQRSASTLRNTRLVSEAGYLDKSKFGEQNTTESTTSTTAPSTVWDELDDLKSRIRKLELTGKLPPSSAAAMSSAERPRTATTAATTMSTSPKHNKSAAQLQPAMEGASPAVHPLLQEALSNAKVVVSHDVFQKLQSTAQDALQLASLTTYDANGRNSASAMTDRQIRRRTESLCRSLTELTIALAAEQKMNQTNLSYQPNNRDQGISPAVSNFRSRTYSQGNEERMPPSARVQSRLETRRVSTQVAYSARHPTPEMDSPTALPAYAHSGGRTTRVASTFRPRRPLDGANEEDPISPAIRPVSRAYTDISAARRVSRDHAALSREYTNQHPMPSTTDVSSTTTRTPLPANLSTNFISRRKFTSPAAAQDLAPDSSPLAPRQSWGRISIVQDNPPPPPSDTASEAPPSSRRSVSAKRSLGFASRLGSSVGNRLRAARIDSRSYRDSSPPIAREDEGGR